MGVMGYTMRMRVECESRHEQNGGKVDKTPIKRGGGQGHLDRRSPPLLDPRALTSLTLKCFLDLGKRMLDYGWFHLYLLIQF
jgi:hypothetical protein